MSLYAYVSRYTYIYIVDRAMITSRGCWQLHRIPPFVNGHFSYVFFVRAYFS